MTPDQLHFEKYLLEQSKKRPKVKADTQQPVIPIEISLKKETVEFFNTIAEIRISLMKL